MRFTLILISIVLIFFSIIILNHKGYFLVRDYSANGREDIEKFLDSNFADQSFVFIDKKEIEIKVLDQFSDIGSISLSRDFKFNMVANIKELTPIGKTNDSKLISDSGVLYYSSSNYPDSLIVFNVGNLEPKIQVLSLDQVYFIQSINEEFSIKDVEVIKPFHFVINLSSVSIEVEKDYSSLPSMLDAVSKYVASLNGESSFSKLIIVDNRIIIKD